MEGTTGYYDSNLNGKASKAAELLTTDAYDFGFVHVKATDDAGHDKSHELKTQQLEKCDAMIATFIEAFRNQKKPGQDVIVCVTGDHSTPTLLGDHTNEPVPILISLLSNESDENEGSSLRLLKDKVERFNEIDCASITKSSLGRFCSIELMKTLVRMKEQVSKVKG